MAEYSQEYLDKNKAHYRAALQAATTADEALDILQIIGHLPIVVHNYSTGEFNIRLLGELSNEDLYNLAQEAHLLLMEAEIRGKSHEIVFQEIRNRLGMRGDDE